MQTVVENKWKAFAIGHYISSTNEQINDVLLFNQLIPVVIVNGDTANEEIESIFRVNGVVVTEDYEDWYPLKLAKDIIALAVATHRTSQMKLGGN